MATASKTRAGTQQLTKIAVKLTGLTPIMFDRYAGDNKTKLTPWQKVYLMPDSETLCLPCLNIISFLSAENTKSAPKVLLDSREYKRQGLAFRNFVTVDGPYEFAREVIPILRNNEPVKLGNPTGDTDTRSGMRIHRCVARLEKGLPNPKERPLLPCPWEMRFTLTLFPNPEVQQTQLHWIFVNGGIAVGLGTFRGSYGKFRVDEWNQVE